MDHSPQLEDTSLAVLEPEKCQPKLEGIEQALNVVPFDKGDEANVKKIVTGLQARGKEAAVRNDASVHQPDEKKNSRRGKKSGLRETKDLKKGKSIKSPYVKNSNRGVSTRVSKAKRLCLVQT